MSRNQASVSIIIGVVVGMALVINGVTLGRSSPPRPTTPVGTVAPVVRGSA